MNDNRQAKSSQNQTLKSITALELSEKCWDVPDPSEWCELYFIGAWVDDNLIAVKIGISKDCEKRVAELQIHTFAELSILGYHTFTSVALARSLEKQAHAELEAYRMRGEWFRPEPAVLKYDPLFLS